MPQGYFITGSDTGVGKTWIGRQIIRQLRDRQYPVKVRKPVESGCQPVDDQLFPHDGNALFVASGRAEDLHTVTPLRFRAAVAPDRAARMENQVLTLDQLTRVCLHQVGDQDWLVVEGAGGFYSPICEDGLNADLARRLDLDVIIIVPDRLGGINQALLTWRAVQREGLRVHAIILNRNNAIQDADLDNLSDLKNHCDVPVYTCPHNGALNAKVV